MARLPPGEAKKAAAGWHIDGGRPVWEMAERPQPRLSLKVAFWLSDTTVPESGAMRVVPVRARPGAFKCS